MCVFASMCHVMFVLEHNDDMSDAKTIDIKIPSSLNFLTSPLLCHYSSL